MVRSEWFPSIVVVRKVLLASVVVVLLAIGVGPARPAVRADPPPAEPVSVPPRSAAPRGPLQTQPFYNPVAPPVARLDAMRDVVAQGDAGACCFGPWGDCTDATEASCEAGGGRFKGTGTECSELACAGACCLAPEGCSDREGLGRCILRGGAYQGDGTLCSQLTIDCPPTTGACCLPTGCEERTPTDCFAGGGFFWGLGTQCFQVASCSPPELRGACCFGDGGCSEERRALCEAAGGTFRGPGTLCFSDTCVGACCFPWACQGRYAPIWCARDGGIFQGVRTLCSDLNSACPMGACCYPWGVCDLTTESQCASGEGEFLGLRTTCKDVTCTGACCARDGSCSETAPWYCDGTFRGRGTSCKTADCPLPGACCFEWGGCGEQYTQEDCTGNGGEFQGPGTSCNNVVCPRRVGACCFGDGSCDDLREAACTDRGGQFLGTDRFCVGSGFANSAGGGSPALSLSQNRETRTRPLARDAGSARTSLGIGSYLCPGACCAFSSSACIDSYDQQSCETFFDGVFQGNGTRCTDEAIECPGEYGACCAQFASGPGYGCADGDGVTAFVCALYGVGGQFTPGVDCAQAGCSATICPGEGDCCTPHRSLGCSDAECCRTVCGVDPLCCVQEFQLGSWDAACVQLANRMCGDGNGGYCAVHLSDLNGDGVVDLLDYRLFQNSFGQ